MLSLIPLKDWIYVTVIGALIVSFGAWTIHERHVGAAHEIAALKASSDKLEQETAKQTAELKAKADMAEQSYAKEILALTNRDPVQSVRLCRDTNSRAVVSKGGRPNPGNAGASAAAPVVQRVPSGDHSGGGGTAGPDISEMLSALAARADQVSATLREFQSR